MPNRYYSDFTGKTSIKQKPPPTGKRGKAAALPNEKPKGRLGGKPYGVKNKHGAGFAHVKTYVGGDY